MWQGVPGRSEQWRVQDGREVYQVKYADGSLFFCSRTIVNSVDGTDSAIMPRPVLLLALAALALASLAAAADDAGSLSSADSPAVSSTAAEGAPVRQAAQREMAREQQPRVAANNTSVTAAGPTAAGPTAQPAVAPATEATSTQSASVPRGGEFPGVLDTTADATPSAVTDTSSAAFPGRAPQVIMLPPLL